MMMRPGRRVGRGGILRTAATTAVVAGTATAVSGGVQRRQADKVQDPDAAAYREQELATQQAAAHQPAPPPPATPPAGNDLVAELNELAQLKAQGLLSDEEFTAAKAKLLG